MPEPSSASRSTPRPECRSPAHRPRRARHGAHHRNDLAVRPGADGVDHELPGDRARADQTPSTVMPRLPSCAAIRTAAVADDEIDRADMVFGARRARLDHLQHDMRGALAEAGRVDRDAGQRRHVMLGLGDVVEADDGEIRARLQPALAQRQHGAEGDRVVEAERRRRRRRPVASAVSRQAMPPLRLVSPSKISMSLGAMP